MRRRREAGAQKTDPTSEGNPRTKEWMEKVQDMEAAEYPLEFGETGLKPQYIVREISRLAQTRSVCTEVGQHQMWAAQYFSHRHPRNFISFRRLGDDGYGFPASIGAKIGRPDETVFDLAGDGSFTSELPRLATAVAYDVQVKVAIFNNGYLGMVRQWQELFYDRRYSQTKLSEIKLRQARRRVRRSRNTRRLAERK